jgi:aminotransferase
MYQPSLGKEELEAIKKVFESNWLGKGPKNDEFIELFAKKLVTDNAAGVGFAEAHPKNLLTISCCTEGLFQVIDLYVEAGQEVILPSVSFIAAANAIVAKGAVPVFCDVDTHTLNPTVEDIEKCITKNTAAVLILHYAGVPCDIENIAKLCSDHNVKLIEDNANSPFSRVHCKSTGTFGDVGIWSFDSMKQLVTGDGGMIYCKNAGDAEKLRKRCYLGLETKSGFSNSVDQKWWEFDISSPSRRCIINDIQAAMGIEQLKKIDSQLMKRKIIHNLYDKELSDIEWLTTPKSIPNYIDSSYYMYHIQMVNPKDRDKLAKYLRNVGIYTSFRYYPLHMVNYYFDEKCRLPHTEIAAKSTLCIPLHQSLSQSDITKIVETIRSFK